MRCYFGKNPATAVAGLGLVFCLSLLATPAGAGPSHSSSSVTPKRWAQFELVSTEADGSVQVGKDVVLSLTLGGVPAGTESVMAIIESAGFQSQTVSLSEDGTPAVYQGTAILEPNSTLKSRTTVHPKAVRVRVSFARAKITGLEEFLKRDFYVTLGDRPPDESEAVTPPRPRTFFQLNQLRHPARVHFEMYPHRFAAGGATDRPYLPAPVAADQIADLLPIGLGFSRWRQRQQIFFRNRRVDGQYLFRCLLHRCCIGIRTFSERTRRGHRFGLVGRSVA